jgi:hypothetical protein
LAAGKNGKAAGPGSVHLEMLKYGGNKIVILLPNCTGKLYKEEKYQKR